jgi:hypothetical protein
VSHAFQNNEGHAGPAEGIADLLVGIKRPGEAAGVVCKIAIDATQSRMWQHAATTDSERESQARFVREGEEDAPLSIVERFQIAVRIVIELE